MDRDDNQGPTPDVSESESLEGGGSSYSDGSTPVTSETGSYEAPQVTSYAPPPPPKKRFRDHFHNGSIYLLIFMLLCIISVVVMIGMYVRSNERVAPTDGTIETQNLSGEALKELADKGNLEVGNPEQVLNIQSNAVFSGTALVRGDLQVGGNIRTGGSLNLTGLNVSGPGSFERLQARELSVAGAGTFTGQLSTQSNFNARGSGTFGGPVSTPVLNANTLQLNGELALNNRIRTGGGRPTAAGANALGSGGTTNISGSDTAGTIVINTGSGPAAGCFTNVTFSRAYSSPRVNVTPVGGAAGSLNWYVNRNASGFSVCTNNAAPAGQSFSFDYFVVD